MIFELMIGAAVGGATYAYSKNKRATTGQSVLAATATGLGSAAATALFFPLLLIGGPLALGYYLIKRNQPKALPPSR